MKMIDAEFISPPSPLVRKTGLGGLDQRLLEKAETKVMSLTANAGMHIADQLKKLKAHIQDESLITSKNARVLDDFTFDLLPLKVDSQMSKNKTLAFLSSDLLSFIENLQSMNIDAYHIIRAHVNAMSLIVDKNITDPGHAFSKAIVEELADARRRYGTKYAISSATTQEIIKDVTKAK